MSGNRTIIESARNSIRRPGWPEIGAGSAAFAVIFGIVVVVLRLVPDDQPILVGLLGFALSAALGLGAFAVAVAVRVRRLSPFGIRKVRARWLLVGAALGVLAYLLSIVASVVYITVSGDDGNVQGGYQAAAGGGALAYIATILLGSVATPIGEEFFWRALVANFLGRWGACVAVLGSAALFALAHGVNSVLPVAFIVGVITALLFRRTGSVWPGVATHAVNNGLVATVPLVVAALG